MVVRWIPVSPIVNFICTELLPDDDDDGVGHDDDDDDDGGGVGVVVGDVLFRGLQVMT